MEPCGFMQMVSVTQLAPGMYSGKVPFSLTVPFGQCWKNCLAFDSK
jgi:hypothetical protein